ncbi:TIGR03668 family PPOX class F420-dependent oxidoreductase [Haladaptatus salinisoli]|uniref:TIGR03668 family PPOX class F420-dependent oxidoreductase n=1 Tax=Haladaptatus salinisoli TaxID=2884876 RepID=UPI001D0A689F|nr:TIGR03668 family PPOX class F420-dependent oxidoreductase [Haladaptatus salinisoli]
MYSERERRFVSNARVARLATVDRDGRPHVVPICFALVGDRLVSPIDEKPKSVDADALTRVRNVRHDPRAAVVVDRYSDDWSRLGWVQIRGEASIREPRDSTFASAVSSLRTKYPQYDDHRLEDRPLVVLDPRTVVSWGNLRPSSNDRNRR